MSERIPLPPPTQALTSTTFVPPPHDLSLTVPEIIDFHRTHSPNHVVYVYEDSPGECKQINFSTWIRAIHRAGRCVHNLFRLSESKACGGKPIISLLANSGEGCPTVFLPFEYVNLTLTDTITYGTTKLGIIRAGSVAFAISPRNSAAGIAHLINKTGTQHVLVTPDLKPLMDATIAILKELEGTIIPAVQSMPTFKDFFPDDEEEDFEYLPEPDATGPDDPICILHSSGV